MLELVGIRTIFWKLKPKPKLKLKSKPKTEYHIDINMDQSLKENIDAKLQNQQDSKPHSINMCEAIAYTVV